jgi:hypothetical protein
VVYVWFACLKLANVTPVVALVAGTVPSVESAWFVPLLGTVEWLHHETSNVPVR